MQINIASVVAEIQKRLYHVESELSQTCTNTKEETRLEGRREALEGLSAWINNEITTKLRLEEERLEDFMKFTNEAAAKLKSPDIAQ